MASLGYNNIHSIAQLNISFFDREATFHSFYLQVTLIFLTVCGLMGKVILAWVAMHNDCMIRNYVPYSREFMQSGMH